VSVDAIVALKTRAQSKMRLASVLGDTAREALVEAMAADVLSCLLMHPEIEAVHVISGAGWSGGDSLPRGVTLWREADWPVSGLVQAYELMAAKSSAERLLFIHADLPCLDQESLSAVIEASAERHAVLCPDHAEVGTNALLRWRDQPLPLCFGDDSLRRHQHAAGVASVPWRIVRQLGLSLDIDLPADLDRVRRGDAPIGERTSAWFHGYQDDLTADATQHAL
jgi:2-phospho-L-lactate guanylyltransferase